MEVQKRCDNCFFSYFATGRGRPALICMQEKGAEGRWRIQHLLNKCDNFYPSSRTRPPRNTDPRLIPLTKGKFAVVDAQDYPELSKHNWSAERIGKMYYAVRNRRKKTIRMHRQIMNAPPELVVDHIDHDGLNNRRSNLRLATIAQNCRNRKGLDNKTSKYKGVFWEKYQRKWGVQITANRKVRRIGCFESEIQAAKEYDKAAKKLHKEFATLNFPDPPT